MLLTKEQEIALAQEIEKGKIKLIRLLSQKLNYYDDFYRVAFEWTTKRRETGGPGQKTDESQVIALDRFLYNEAQDQEILKVPLELIEKLVKDNYSSEILVVLENTRNVFDQMIIGNLCLVVDVVKKEIHKTKRLEFRDLVNEGVFGLIVAIEKFNWRKGYKFSTYAIYRIHRTVERAIKNQDRIIRAPEYVFRKSNDLELPPRPVSIETVVIQTKKGSPKRLKDYLPSEYSVPDQEIEKIALREEIERVLQELKPKERNVIKLRYFGKEETLEVVGKKIGVSRQRAEQIEKEAFEKLRHPAKLAKLKELLGD